MIVAASLGSLVIITLLLGIAFLRNGFRRDADGFRKLYPNAASVTYFKKPGLVCFVEVDEAEGLFYKIGLEQTNDFGNVVFVQLVYREPSYGAMHPGSTSIRLEFVGQAKEHYLVNGLSSNSKRRIAYEMALHTWKRSLATSQGIVISDNGEGELVRRIVM